MMKNYEHVDKIITDFLLKRLRKSQFKKNQQHHAEKFKKTLSVMFSDFW